jgi:hypothetical protein
MFCFTQPFSSHIKVVINCRTIERFYISPTGSGNNTIKEKVVYRLILITKLVLNRLNNISLQEIVSCHKFIMGLFGTA